MKEPSPPRFARQLLGWIAPPGVRAALDGDLLEEFHRDLTTRGVARARRNYVTHVCRSAWPLLSLDTRWSDVPRIVGATLIAIFVVGACSHLVGVALESIGFRQPQGAMALSIHVGVVVLCASVAGYGASWLGGRAGMIVCALSGTLLVLPAVIALREPGAPYAIMVAWIALLPIALLAGGSVRMRRTTTR